MSIVRADDATNPGGPPGAPPGAPSTGEGLGERAPVFEAVIAPHRSLTRRGILTLLAVLVLASSAIAVRFWFIGAWPVIAFSGVEVLLAALLLLINCRRAAARELIHLSAVAITVTQTDHYGRRRVFSLPSAWVQVHLESMNNHGFRLLLSSHGRGREVGTFLHDPEKLSLFKALRDALHALRHPQFDNPQLREG